MKKSKKVLLVLIPAVILAAMGGLLWWFLGRGGASASGEGVYVDSVGVITGLNMGTESRYSGVIEAQKTLDIQADASKTVKEIYVEEGQTVKAGDPLFAYDVDELKLKLQQAQLELEGIQNQINTLNSQIETITREKASAPASEQLSYTLQIQSLQLDVRTQEYNLTAKKVEIGRIEKSVENAVVVSDMDGTVKAVNDNSGNDIYGEPKPLISILNSGNYQIKCKVSELSVNSLYEGMTMRVISRVNPEDTWSGVITKIDRENPAQENNNIYYEGSDSMTKATNYYFYVELDSFEGLMLGQHVYVEADYGFEAKSGLWLSEYYFFDIDEKIGYVWAENEKGAMEKRRIELGEYDEELMEYEVLSGLDTEDYITFPSDDITEGAKALHYSDAFFDGGVSE